MPTDEQKTKVLKAFAAHYGTDIVTIYEDTLEATIAGDVDILWDKWTLWIHQDYGDTNSLIDIEWDGDTVETFIEKIKKQGHMT